jgi:hypothetical protein
MNLSIENPLNVKFDDRYAVNATTKCSYLKVTAMYVITLFLVSVVTNVTLLWVLLRRKDMRTPVI